MPNILRVIHICVEDLVLLKITAASGECGSPGGSPYPRRPRGASPVELIPLGG